MIIITAAAGGERGADQDTGHEQPPGAPDRHPHRCRRRPNRAGKAKGQTTRQDQTANVRASIQFESEVSEHHVSSGNPWHDHSSGCGVCRPTTGYGGNRVEFVNTRRMAGVFRTSMNSGGQQQARYRLELRPCVPRTHDPDHHVWLDKVRGRHGRAVVRHDDRRMSASRRRCSPSLRVRVVHRLRAGSCEPH
jgi:hypothetical protein